jgi:hypothetical protein
MARCESSGDDMTTSKLRREVAARRARRAYEASHLRSAMLGLAVVVAVTIVATALHRTTAASWLLAITLAATLATLAWRGGAWRRGAFAGVLAGLPPLIVPSLIVAMSTSPHCEGCVETPMWGCVLACFGTSSIVGVLVGHRALTDRSPLRYALAALSTAALTGVLGCGTTGLGGVAGVVVGLAAGGVTGWLVGGRRAHASPTGSP